MVHTSSRQVAPSEISAEDLNTAFRAATASQKKEFQTAAMDRTARDPSLRVGKKYTAKDLHAWLHSKRSERNDSGQPKWKKAQMDIVELIIHRMCEELNEQ